MDVIKGQESLPLHTKRQINDDDGKTPAGKKPRLILRITTKEEKTEDGEHIVVTREEPPKILYRFQSKAYSGKLCPYLKLVYSIGAQFDDGRKFERAIPNFDRLLSNTQKVLPRYIFRVVHSASAGKVIRDGNNMIHFLSEAYPQNDAPSCLSSFTLEDIQSQILHHVSSHKTADNKPFFSHWISTTDSFEAAIFRAEKEKQKSVTQDVFIYVIDTFSLQRPAFACLMALALRAWSACEKIPFWRQNYFAHGALTEWIFWDSISAANVDVIDYKNLYHQNGSNFFTLRRIMPELIQAAKGKESRAVLHERMPLKTIRAQEQNILRAQHSLSGRMSRGEIARLLSLDRRAPMDASKLEEVWEFVKRCSSRNLLFMWLLSLMTGKYFEDTIVEKVIEHYPHIIEENLEMVTGDRGDDMSDDRVLVYYAADRGCGDRIDVNEFQDLMEHCIEAWYRSVNMDERHKNHKHHGVPVRIIHGIERPDRNLVKLTEVGLLGLCRAEPLLPGPQAAICKPSFATASRLGKGIRLPETDEEHMRRLRREGNHVVHTPSNILGGVSTTTRHKDKSHRCGATLPEKRYCQAVLTIAPSHCQESRAPQEVLPVRYSCFTPATGLDTKANSKRTADTNSRV